MLHPATPLGRGASGPQVAALQTRLNALGASPPLAVDGIFGPRTAAALQQFEAGAGNAPATAGAASLTAAVLALADTQVGVREQPPGSNRGPEVDRYLQAAGLDAARGSYAWCAAFLCWLFAESAGRLGVENPMPREAGVLNLWRRLGERGRLLLPAAAARADPAQVTPGMVFFLRFSGGLGHAGLVRAVDGPRLVTIEGNTTNRTGSREGIGVFRRTRRTIAAVNLGFADPARPG